MTFRDFHLLITAVLFFSVCHAQGTTQWDGAKVVDGKCYLLVRTAVKWGEAKKACEDIGGTLATVASDALMSDIRSAFNFYDVSYWIGLNDIATEGTYVWTEDGSTASGISSLWGEDRPVTEPGNEFDCIYIDENNKYLDVQCGTVATYYLCMEPSSTTKKCPAPSAAAATTAAATTAAATTIGNSEVTTNAPTTTIVTMPSTPKFQKPKKSEDPCKKRFRRRRN